MAEDRVAALGRDLTPEEYAWSCAEDMRGWAMRAEDTARELREESFRLRRVYDESLNAIHHAALDEDLTHEERLLSIERISRVRPR